MELPGPVELVLPFFLIMTEEVLLMAMDSGLPLDKVETVSQQVPTELYGLVVLVKPFFLLMDTVLFLIMDSGLPLDKVQTALRRVPMGLLGLVKALPFLLIKDWMSLTIRLIHI